MKRLIIIAVIIILAVLGWAGWYWLAGNNNKTTYRSARIEKGNIIQTVNATGTIQPIKLVQVGTQVTGPMIKLTADYNSRVQEGEIIAQIDPAVYQARVAQDKANLIKSEAEVERVKANLLQAEKELVRARELAQHDLISQSELDAAVATHDGLAAQLKIALASVEQSKSTLQTSEINLAYTTIRSPVNGTVISRKVNEGQTVVASLSAQTIFEIATDIKKIQVEASVPEADIGKIKTNDSVIFTVDAYPNMEFSGTVTQTRLAPTTVQNVVTYTVIITAGNPEEKLLPGMTANIIFETDRRENVLKIPNAALRFKPEESMLTENYSKNIAGPVNQPAGFKKSAEKHFADIWINTPDGLKKISVKTGLTDGSFTEMVEGNLSEGQEVLTGIIEKDEKKTLTNPFNPPRQNRRGMPR